MSAIGGPSLEVAEAAPLLLDLCRLLHVGSNGIRSGHVLDKGGRKEWEREGMGPIYDLKNRHGHLGHFYGRSHMSRGTTHVKRREQ